MTRAGACQPIKWDQRAMIDTQPKNIDPRWAWQRYRPGPDAPWDLKKVGHLYRRGDLRRAPTCRALENAPALEPRLQVPVKPASPGPARSARRRGSLGHAVTRGIRQVSNGDQLAAAWLYRMLCPQRTALAAEKRMTLFWHNHFATSNRKVQNAAYMLGQNRGCLRRHLPWSDFRTLLQEVSHDPAMMVWLDTIQSRRGQANENYARELMELFSLGIRRPRQAEERNYTEQDVREAARAFTGWTLESGRPAFHADQHDDGEKKAVSWARTGPRSRLRGYRAHLPGAGGNFVFYRPQAIPLSGQRDGGANDRAAWATGLLLPESAIITSAAWSKWCCVPTFSFPTTCIGHASKRPWISPHGHRPARPGRKAHSPGACGHQRAA